MAESTRERRQAGREERRSRVTEPFEELDDAAEQQSQGGKSDPLAGVKRAAATAAAAALAGALVGAGKAFLDRRSRSGSPETDEAPKDESGEELSESPAQPAEDDATAADDTTEPDQPTAATQEETEEGEEADNGDAVAEAPEDEPEAVSSSQPDREGDSEPRGDDREEPRQPEEGASNADIEKILDRARSHVQEILGKKPESLTGVERSNGSWSVSVEVVELNRVPDTTDVLGSYEVVLDGDGDLVRLERTGRYLRSQVEERA